MIDTRAQSANFGRLPGRKLLNLRLGIESENWTLGGYVTNVLDNEPALATLNFVNFNDGNIGLDGVLLSKWEYGKYVVAKPSVRARVGNRIPILSRQPMKHAQYRRDQTRLIFNKMAGRLPIRKSVESDPIDLRRLVGVMFSAVTLSRCAKHVVLNLAANLCVATDDIRKACTAKLSQLAPAKIVFEPESITIA